MPKLQADARLSVSSEIVSSVDRRIFGQFFERPSWGETGPEGVLDENHKLPADIVERLAAMDIPVVRFPGGTDIDYIDWTDMIDNAPTRPQAARPVTVGHKGDEITNYFGYDEYLNMAEQMGWESMLVVNFLDGLSGKKPLDEAAAHAAGLLAYCNGTPGENPGQLAYDWPDVRVKNGRTAPWNIRYVQIGNECFLRSFRKLAAQAPAIAEADSTLEAKTSWYIKALVAYARKLKSVDADIEIIFDARLGQRELSMAVLADEQVRDLIDYVTIHKYGPMGVNVPDWGAAGEPKNKREILFGGLSAMPALIYDDRATIASPEDLAAYREMGYKLASTEWNWNGWSIGNLGSDRSIAPLASALGSAQYIHAMMNDGVSLATQSMLVGHGWNISAIHVDIDASDGIEPTFMAPQAMATDLYNHHSGTRVPSWNFDCDLYYDQPIKLGYRGPREHMPLIDEFVTLDDNYMYVHLINHSVDRDFNIDLSLDGFDVDVDRPAIQWYIDGTLEAAKWSQAAKYYKRNFTLSGDGAVLMLPAHSVSIFEIPIKPEAEQIH